MIEEYEYVKVNMTPEEIAHAIIDGEVFYEFDGEKFYTFGGDLSLYWDPDLGFAYNDSYNAILSGSLYRRIKIKKNQ